MNSLLEKERDRPTKTEREKDRQTERERERERVRRGMRERGQHPNVNPLLVTGSYEPEIEGLGGLHKQLHNLVRGEAWLWRLIFLLMTHIV